MTLELHLHFPDPDHVVVSLDHATTQALPFAAPIGVAEMAELHWYLETYAASYTTDVDDARAARIAGDMARWGAALFAAVFTERAAQRLFNTFQDQTDAERLITIGAEHPRVLALPWELLRDPSAGGVYLFNENPRISIRRRISGVTGGRSPFKVRPKAQLHLLLVISRPDEAGFIDPRADAHALLAAIDAQASGRVTIEFLRPPTLQHLVARLEDKMRPPVDIVHFDGHGVFDRTGAFSRPPNASQAATPSTVAAVKRAEGMNTGYLLFEDAEGKSALVAAPTLGELLNRQRVALIVLSACQSATQASDSSANASDSDPTALADAMGSVAVRLNAAGIPSVLAMSYTVLVQSTEQLFGEFYAHLGRGATMGVALDNARRLLFQQPEKHEVQRGLLRQRLTLYDWFVPVLHQTSADLALLKPSRAASKDSALPTPHNPLTNLLPVQEAGFWGRKRELWEMERWLVQGTRRITLSGFGGQGKSALAQEAGRWWLRTGLFQAVVFVPYVAFQGVDPVGYAVSTLATVLGENLLDKDAANAALARTPTLLILDNLEALPDERLSELLGTAVAWSEAGQSRLLLTTRTPQLPHASYPSAGSHRHRAWPLRGLSPSDALDYYAALWSLPPAAQIGPHGPDALLRLFQPVDNHPLSIGLLAQQLKTQYPTLLGARLAELLVATPDNPLLASLNLSLERLPAAVQQWLPRLGVFQGGALEPELLASTEIPADAWPLLRAVLHTTGLLEIEELPDVTPPYLHFHPTLAPALWTRLDAEQQATLSARHRQRYYGLSDYLYAEDVRNPHAARAMARRELPNLLHAVHAALTAGDADAVDFADKVNLFLSVFGLNRDREHLTQRANQTTGVVGSRAWFLARFNQGEQLFASGRYAAAAALFLEILTGLGVAPSYERCVMLSLLGRCLQAQGRPDQAEVRYRQALTMATTLEQSTAIQRQQGLLQTDLGNLLQNMGNFEGARQAYEAALIIAKNQQDERQIGVVESDLGALALVEGDLAEAAQRYLDALRTFQRLGEPAVEAMYWHQLGRVYQEAKQWEAAEQAYRESARLEEAQGNLQGAAGSWDGLAQVCKATGNAQAAEDWYRKALAGRRDSGDRMGEAITLNNLAALLHTLPGRLAEARQVAEAALVIQQTLEPGVAEIWKAYTLLSWIADQQNQPAAARAYRRQARQAKAAWPGMPYELQKHASLIEAVVQAVAAPQRRAELEPDLEQLVQNGWGKLVAALRRLLDGERDADALCDELDSEAAMIVLAILAQLRTT